MKRKGEKKTNRRTATVQAAIQQCFPACRGHAAKDLRCTAAHLPRYFGDQDLILAMENLQNEEAEEQK